MSGMRARLLALACLGLAALIVALSLGGGHGYTVRLLFQNAGQLVGGDRVEVSGVQAGSVQSIKITPDGQAQVTITVDKPFAPLRQGTKAIVRQASLTGVANRYVELQLPAFNRRAGRISDGGVIGTNDTTAIVEFDQLLDTFDKPTRAALRGFIAGSARQYAGETEAANQGLHYLDPSLSTSSSLFREVNRDTPVLEGFLQNGARLTGALAARAAALTGIVHYFNIVARQIGDQRAALAESLLRLPGFMRQSNSTFVDLRAALGDLDPLVDASKPVARRLQPFLPQLDVLERDARPTVSDLATVIRAPGPSNDLTELVRTFGPLAHEALDTRRRDGADRPGSVPETAKALRDSAPTIAFGRPYTVDFLGWFDDFGFTGGYDALGSYARAHTYVNAFTPSTEGLPRLIPLDQRGQEFMQVARVGQYRRCPGASEAPLPDGSNVWPASVQSQLDCRESDRAVRP